LNATNEKTLFADWMITKMFFSSRFCILQFQIRYQMTKVKKLEALMVEKYFETAQDGLIIRLRLKNFPHGKTVKHYIGSSLVITFCNITQMQ